MSKKQLQGIVVSDRMQKTAVVRVECVKVHPKYKKRFKSHKKYKAHTDRGCQSGDTVIIEECRPLSREKKWKIVKILNSKSEIPDPGTANPSDLNAGQ